MRIDNTIMWVAPACAAAMIAGVGGCGEDEEGPGPLEGVYHLSWASCESDDQQIISGASAVLGTLEFSGQTMIVGNNDDGCRSSEFHDLSGYGESGFTATIDRTEVGEGCADPSGTTRPGSGGSDDYRYQLSGGGVLRLTEVAGAGGRCTSYVAASVSGSERRAVGQGGGGV